MVVPCIRTMCLLSAMLAYPWHVQCFMVIRDRLQSSPARPSLSLCSANGVRMRGLQGSEERHSTIEQIPVVKSTLGVIRTISFGEKFKVEKGLHGKSWRVRRPRLWQEKAAGFLLCFHWNNVSMTWTPNTYVRKTKLLTASGDSMGRGLFAMRDFTEGEVIGQYVGKVVGSSDNKDDAVLKAYVQGMAHSVVSHSISLVEIDCAEMC
jgi:hypothetical protein